MHFNLVDVLVVILSIGAILRGFQIGLIRQAFSTVSFLAGLYPGTLLSSMIMAHVTGTTKPVVGLVVLLGVCFVCMTIGEAIAVRIKVSVHNRTAQHIDNTAGSIMSVVTLLLGLWLASALFALAPPSSTQNQIKNSAIISALNDRLPPAARILTALNKLIDPNQSPQVFSGKEPSPDANHKLPDTAKYAGMLNRVQASVVKIEGLGCGGIVDGSGFVYSPGLVATNAHVVAGVNSPKVRQGSETENTVVVYFDPINDIAILRVNGLNIPPLPLNPTISPRSSHAFALGYPGGGNYHVSPAVVLDEFKALGQDIYGQARTTRSVYSLQTNIVRGNSGGPVVDTEGNVIGIVFAASTTYNNVGYALTIQQVSSGLATANTANRAVSTGQCSE